MRGRHTFLLNIPLTGPLNLADTKFQELKALETLPPPCDHAPRSKWMSEVSLYLIDESTYLRCRPDHNRNMDSTLMRVVCRSLTVDSRLREDMDAEEICACL